MSEQVTMAIELGFRAPKEAIVKAAKIADKKQSRNSSDSLVDEFLVCETFPKRKNDPMSFGVDAFETMEDIVKETSRIKLGTGIVSCFSRNLEEIKNLSVDLYNNSQERFSLGIGTGPKWAANKWGVSEFEKPLTRMIDYVNDLKEDSPEGFKIYAAANGPKMIESMSVVSDGIKFFMKPKKVLKNDIEKIIQYRSNLKRNYDDFDVSSIVPVYLTNGGNVEQQSYDKAVYYAQLTIANYIIGNEFYRRDLIDSGYGNTVEKVLNNSRDLKAAAFNVSHDLLDELTIRGKPDHCVNKLKKYVRETGVKTIVAGFDLSEDGFNDNFFEKLRTFCSYYH